MGKKLKILGGTALVAALGVAAFPTLFRPRIEAFANEVIADFVRDADASYTDYSLSIVSSFPHFRTGLDGITIVGRGKFEGDTLLHIGKLRADLDLRRLVTTGDVQVNGIIIDDLRIHGIVAADSTVNWDILNLSPDTAEVDVAEADTVVEAPLQLNLKRIDISNCQLAYSDSTSNLFASLSDLALNSRASISGSNVNIDATLDIPSISAQLGNVKYLKGVPLNFIAKANMDLDSLKFAFDQNQLTFAGLPLAFDGWLQLKDSAVALDMKLMALQTQFKTILDLLPADVLKSVEGFTTTGSFQFFAMAKGEYIDEKHIPEALALLKVRDGYVKYPDLPKSLQDINLSLVVKSPGGDMDNLTLDVDTMHFLLGENPFDVTASVVKPISNPTFNVKANGIVQLDNIKDALPLENMEISGRVDADLNVASNLDDINAQRYEKVNAVGTLGLSKFMFRGSVLPSGLDITKAKLAFSPKALNLDPLDVVIGQSDISLIGNVENYLPYLLSNGTLMGSATLRSKLLDCNELLEMTSSSSPADTTASQATPSAESSAPLELPKNINFRFNTNIDKLKYDKLEVDNISGVVALADGVANLSNLSLDACGGKMTLTGKLQTPAQKNPDINMNVNMANVDINKMTGSFSIVDSLLPIAHNAHGTVNLALNVKAQLDSELSPILSTVNGNGTFKSQNIALKDSEFQKNLSRLLANDKYNDIDIKNCSVKYTIENGNVIIPPFDFKLFNNTATFGGQQGLDQSMNYSLSVPIPRAELANTVGKLGISLGEGADLPIGISIGGVLTKPELKLDMSKATEIIKDEAKSVASEKANEALDKAIDKIGNERVKDAANKGKNILNNILNKKK